MSTSLKTYSDGSEITIAGAAALAAICVITGAVGAVSAVKWDAWREKRIMKKHKIGPYAR